MIDEDYSVDRVHDITKIDKWFLHKLDNIVQIRRGLQDYSGKSVEAIPQHVLTTAKKAGFSDLQIAQLIGSTELEVRAYRKSFGLVPVVKRIDTLAAEFPAPTNYLYTTYNGVTNDVKFEDKGVIVLGSGVYRIGSSVEFDWCGVSTIRTLKELGMPTVMINYNPETVSTDFDECDRLYFEELSFERVMDIYELEQSRGVVVSVGGQLPQNIALKLWNNNVNVLGTSPVDVDRAEDREKFSKTLDDIGVDQPDWKELTDMSSATDFASRVGYPVLVRPSYVLSGAAMKVAHTPEDLVSFLKNAADVSKEHPVVISKFIEGAQELDVDAVAHHGKLLTYAVSQHVENAGVHSGDATLILPPLIATEDELDGWDKPGIKPLSMKVIDDCKVIAERVAHAFKITGPFNMQIIKRDLPPHVHGNHQSHPYELKVIECNLRASRSFPFVSKTLEMNFIDLATRALVNHPSVEFVTPTYDLMHKERDYKCVKVPIFSWTRLGGADPILGVEMASTGEVACFGKDVHEAFLVSLLSNHQNVKQLPMPLGSSVAVGRDHLTDTREFVYICDSLNKQGYKVLTDSQATTDLLRTAGVDSNPMLYKINQGEQDELIEFLKDKHKARHLFADERITLTINLARERPLTVNDHNYMMRRISVDLGVGIINDSKVACVLVDALAKYNDGTLVKRDCVHSWQEWRA